MRVSNEKQKEIAAYIGALKEIGLYDKEQRKKINAYYDNPHSEERFLVNRKYGGNPVTFELNPVITNGKMELTGYAVLIPVHRPLPEHFASNGIDSRELDARMQQINWKNHPGNFFDNIGEVNPEKKRWIRYWTT